MGNQVKTAVTAFEAALAGKSVQWPRGSSSARIAMSRFGGIPAFEARVPALRIVAPARRDAAPVWHLVVHLAGDGCYRVNGREIAQRPGAVVLAEGRAECAVEHTEGAHVVSWVLPGDLIEPYLPPRPETVAEVTGGLGSVVGQHAVALMREARHIEASAADGLVGHLAAVVGLALATGRAEDSRARPGHRALMRQQLLGYIEARFHEPGLTGTTAAKQLGVSRRWVHMLLAESGSSFSERLRERRLAEGMRLLRDPAADHLSVTEIGFAVGFNDLSTFHRQFRRRYDATPGQARAARM